jgi:hypothetical protein
MGILSFSRGYDVDYLTKAVAAGRESYYTNATINAGEPAGLWYGQGAAHLGLNGEVDADLMKAIYLHGLDPRDQNTHSTSTWGLAEKLGAGPRNYRSPDDLYEAYVAADPLADDERKAELRAAANRNAQQNLKFLDATYSPPKSVTVLALAFERAENDARAAGEDEAAEAWGEMRIAVEDAVMAGARASIDYLQDAAGYSQVGKHGGGQERWMDSHDWTVAQFLQHDSREHDPQLHVHQAILNKTLRADGTWGTLDSRMIHKMGPAASAIGGRTTMERLSQVLGVRTELRPDGKAFEIVDVPQQLMDAFSTRRRAVTGKAAELTEAFTARFGREPTALERAKISQQATLVTRKAKTNTGETREEMLNRWERESRETYAKGLADVARDVLANREPVAPASFDVEDTVTRGIAAASAKRATWSRANLMGAINAALPANLGMAPDRIRPLLENLTDRGLARVRALRPGDPDAPVVPRELQLADGRSSYVAPGSERFASPEQVNAERELRRASVIRGAFALPVEDANALVEGYARHGWGLGEDQKAAVRGILTSGAAVEVLAAPAGTGKSYVVGALAKGLSAHDRKVVGLAPSQAAADVLADEGVTAANIDRWLYTQMRIADGREREGDSQHRLGDGDVVVVDEAGMASTQQIAEIRRWCESQGAKLVLTGDPKQLGAVGPGGALADLGEHAERYELSDVRRFTAEWERKASLQLRDGDPLGLAEYEKAGRLLGHGTGEQAGGSALRAWLADTLAGKDSALLVSSNEEANRLSGLAREELARMGALDTSGPSVKLGRDDNHAGVGDLVQARLNAWGLEKTVGHAPINRATYRVTDVHEDGSLGVAPVLGRIEGSEFTGDSYRLPAEYVRDNLSLAYAATVHAAQGRTLDTSHAVIDPSKGMTTAAAYVALTRGRDGNWAHIVTREPGRDEQTGRTHEIIERDARAVMAELLERDGADRSALQQSEQAEEEDASTFRNVGVLLDGASRATAGRTSRTLDYLTADGVLSDEDRTALAADEATGSVERILRTAELAGHDRDALLRDALADRDLSGARSVGQVLYARVQRKIQDDERRPRLQAFSDLVPEQGSEEMRRWLRHHADRADTRRHELGGRVAHESPRWALDALGPVPDEPLERQEWEHKAGWAAAYREMAQHDDDEDALGTPPPAGLAEKHAIWRTAMEELDLPDVGVDEKLATDGALRNRVAAFKREEVWAPKRVADDLAAVNEQLDKRRQDAELWKARATQLADEVERERLKEEADRAELEAGELQLRAAELQEVDDARARWYAMTSTTRDYARRAAAELAARGVDLDDKSARVTGEEWLAEQERQQRREEKQTDVPADAVVDEETAPVDDDTDDGKRDVDGPVLETAVPDIRETKKVDEPKRVEPPKVEETPPVDEPPKVKDDVPAEPEKADDKQVAETLPEPAKVEQPEQVKAEKSEPVEPSVKEDKPKPETVKSSTSTDADVGTSESNARQKGDAEAKADRAEQRQADDTAKREQDEERRRATAERKRQRDNEQQERERQQKQDREREKAKPETPKVEADKPADKPEQKPETPEKRVPSIDETRASVNKARDAIIEMRQREAEDRRREEDDRNRAAAERRSKAEDTKRSDTRVDR